MDIEALLAQHPFEPNKIYSRAAERVLPNGLAVATTIYWGKDADHVTVSERTETFVAEARYTDNREGHLFLRKGDRVWLWRTETVHSSGYAARDGARYHGFTRGGNQSTGADSDAEAQSKFATLRNPAGKVLRAADDPQYEKAGERYSDMMSR